MPTAETTLMSIMCPSSGGIQLVLGETPTVTIFKDTSCHAGQYGIHVLYGSENKNIYVRDMAIEKEEITKSAHFTDFIIIVTAVDFFWLVWQIFVLLCSDNHVFPIVSIVLFHSLRIIFLRSIIFDIPKPSNKTKFMKSKSN